MGNQTGEYERLNNQGFKLFCQECGGLLSKTYKHYYTATHQAWRHQTLHTHDVKVVEVET